MKELSLSIRESSSNSSGGASSLAVKAHVFGTTEGK